MAVDKNLGSAEGQSALRNAENEDFLLDIMVIRTHPRRSDEGAKRLSIDVNFVNTDGVFTPTGDLVFIWLKVPVLPRLHLEIIVFEFWDILVSASALVGLERSLACWTIERIDVVLVVSRPPVTEERFVILCLDELIKRQSRASRLLS